MADWEMKVASLRWLQRPEAYTQQTVNNLCGCEIAARLLKTCVETE
jgi:hypothetical protein